jgi:hypothetical protein
VIQLATWLLCPWRHVKGDGYASVIAAAQKLDAAIWDAHRIKLLFCDCPWRFRDLSTAEVERAHRAMGCDPETAPDFPQLGTHADPTCRHLTSENFYALIGTKTDRPLPVITMNTASRYDAAWAGDNLLSLFGTRRLWSDHPDRDCAGVEVAVPAWQATEAEDRLPAVFLGTAYTVNHRRKQGIMETVSRLHRMVAYLKYGPLPQFATIAPNRQHDKLFHGRDIGAVIEKRDGLSTEIRVLFYEPDAAVSDAAEVIAETERRAVIAS